jgi:peptidoglycan/xylan/chitin deacetylase (PgdA/CDA1 family)
MIQKILTPLLLRSGAVSMVRESTWRRNRLAILCYHSFSSSDEHVWDGSLYMRPEALEQRFEFLRANRYRVLSLSEGLKHLREGTLPERSVALTFDDGTRDFANIAVPLLEKFGFPATVYLSTWYCGQPRPIFQGFTKYLLWKGRTAYRGGPLWNLPGPFDLETPEGRHQAVEQLRGATRGVTLDERDRIQRSIAEALGVDYDAALAKTNFSVMPPEQVAEVSRNPLVSVELHTHRHRTPLDHALFTEEIGENRRRIEAMTGVRPKHFCYPSGVHDEHFLPWLTQLGVESATTGEPGLASRESNPLLLPRIVDTSFLSLDRFAVWLSGAGHFTRRRGRMGGRAQSVPPVTSSPQFGGVK